MATELPAISPVLDVEPLFRAVRDDVQYYSCDTNGVLRKLSASAFNDRDMEPSVDRASLRPGGPSDSRKSDTDGVISLVAREVRSIKAVVTLDKKAHPVNNHQVDVVHAPEIDNHSHALVKTAPTVANDSTFKRLKEALCRLAESKGWAFPPHSLRS